MKYDYRYNPVGINIPLPDNTFYNTEYPKLVNGVWVETAVDEVFYRD